MNESVQSHWPSPYWMLIFLPGLALLLVPVMRTLPTRDLAYHAYLAMHLALLLVAFFWMKNRAAMLDRPVPFAVLVGGLAAAAYALQQLVARMGGIGEFRHHWTVLREIGLVEYLQADYMLRNFRLYFDTITGRVEFLSSDMWMLRILSVALWVAFPVAGALMARKTAGNRGDHGKV